MLRTLVAVCALVSSTACLRATTTITVKADGSGVIDQEVGAAPQTLAMIKGFAGARGQQPAQGEKDAAPASFEIFGPEQAQKIASAMNVTFVSGEPIKTADLEGYRAHYKFDDITKVKVNATQSATSGLGAEASAAPQEPPFAFDFLKGVRSSVLTVKLPPQKPNAGVLPQMPGANSPQESAQALSMMSMMMRGMFIDVSLNVDGKVVKTNAPYVSGSQLTLMQVDFDKVLAADPGLQKLTKVTDPKQLKDMPGIKIVSEPTLTIEFAK